MIIYLLIGTILTVVLLGIDNINPVGERLIDDVGKGVVFIIAIDVIAWPLMMAFFIKGMVAELIK